jgi:hypothetical protein
MQNPRLDELPSIRHAPDDNSELGAQRFEQSLGSAEVGTLPAVVQMPADPIVTETRAPLQRRQDLELDRTQFDLSIPDCDETRLRVEARRAEWQRCASLNTASYGTKARQKLDRLKRLDQVVVSPEVESTDPVFD